MTLKENKPGIAPKNKAISWVTMALLTTYAVASIRGTVSLNVSVDVYICPASQEDLTWH
jgi:hypothetical protein